MSSVVLSWLKQMGPELYLWHLSAATRLIHLKREPDPKLSHPKTSSSHLEPNPWHIRRLKPQRNLPWRCARIRTRLRAFAVLNRLSSLLSSFPVDGFKVASSSSPAQALPGLNHVRAKCACPCYCKLCLCKSITKDLGKNSMPAHLMFLRKHMWRVHVAKRDCWLLFTSVQMPWQTVRMPWAHVGNTCKCLTWIWEDIINSSFAFAFMALPPVFFQRLQCLAPT